MGEFFVVLAGLRGGYFTCAKVGRGRQSHCGELCSREGEVPGPRTPEVIGLFDGYGLNFCHGLSWAFLKNPLFRLRRYGGDAA